MSIFPEISHCTLSALPFERSTSRDARAARSGVQTPERYEQGSEDTSRTFVSEAHAQIRKEKKSDRYFICRLTPELSRAERGGWEPVLLACQQVSTKPRHGVGLNDLLGGRGVAERKIFRATGKLGTAERRSPATCARPANSPPAVSEGAGPAQRTNSRRSLFPKPASATHAKHGRAKRTTRRKAWLPEATSAAVEDGGRPGMTGVGCKTIAASSVRTIAA